MKRIFMLMVVMLLLPLSIFAVVVEDVNIPDNYVLNGKELVLNGYGLRKKFFIKVYIGALYLEKKSQSPAEIYDMDSKVIKMHFLYKKVDSSKMKEAFEDGFKNNGVSNMERFKQFIDVFNFDVMKGDEIDLVLSGDTVMVVKNSSKLAEFTDKELVNAVMKVYIGEKPADSGLKDGMLSK
ncbi:MAG: hypothetical protein PWQ25_1605 [Deferribacteres bacterium]|jgi:hypothetical protein|nr:hypothetical protein [Deferribacteraceae bacterium]MDK2792742.1 hypothetical protein [Deferribacteres bacterium]